MLVAISVIYVGIAFVELVATSRAIAPFENIVGSASALLGSRSMGVALHLLKTLFLPFLLAVYISLGLSSFVGLLVQRLRLPTTAAVGITLLITLVVFWLVGLLLVTSVEHDGERQSTQPIRIGGVGDGQRADRTLAIVADGRTIAGSNARAWPARDSIRGPTPFRRRGFTGPILRAVQGETMRFKATLGTMLLAAATLAGAANEKLMIDGFSAGDLKIWQTKSFKGETRYTFNGKGGRRALFADSQGGASGLYRKIPVDLNRTPWLNWSWRVDKVLTGVDERSKTGDDYPARVYVVVSGGAAFWKTRSLVYVWSSNQRVGATWNNAFTSKAQVMALRSGTKDAGRWVSEKRDIRADFRQLFGEDVSAIDAVALMTDTDNSGQSATAWYGDIYFTAQ